MRRFAALGAEVLIAEAQDRILPLERILEASEVIEKHLKDRFGVKVLTDSRAVALQRDNEGQQVIFAWKSRKGARVEAIVLATTTEPSTDIGLENAGVKYSYRGIQVDQKPADNKSSHFGQLAM